jgi:hypothetical protein
MTLLGTLLRNHRSRDAHSAWNRLNLQGPQTLTVTSRHVEDGRPIPLEHVGADRRKKRLPAPRLEYPTTADDLSHRRCRGSGRPHT